MKRPFKTYDFQEEGIERAVTALQTVTLEGVNGVAFNPHAFLLHDEMGLGKTIQAFEILLRLNLNGPVLIVVPSSCIHIWTQNEHYSSRFDVRTFVRESVSTKTLLNMTARTIVVTSYDTLRNAYKYYISAKIDHGGLSNEELVRYCLVNGKNFLDRTRLLHDPDTIRRELLEISRQIKQKPGKSHLACPAFMKQVWSLAIFDEVHKTRSPESSTTKAIGFISAHYRLALSGTPIMNDADELLCIWKYAMSMFDLNWTEIVRDPSSEYCRTIIDAISLGRKKADIAELAGVLPKRNRELESLVFAWTDAYQKQAYIDVKTESIEYLKRVEQLKRERLEDATAFNKRRMSMQQCFMGKMQTLRQICLHPRLPDCMKDGSACGANELHWHPANHHSFPPWTRRRVVTLLKCLYRYRLHRNCIYGIIARFVAADSLLIQPSPKMIYVAEELQRMPQTDKMLVFSTFKVFLVKIMQPWLDQIGVSSLVFSGGSASAQRRALEEFRNDPTIRVLLLVKMAGSEGLNMQFDASTCIIMDPHFNLALDEQAAQRIDRIGQTKEVVVRKLYMKGSIDEAMRIMQDEKQADIEAWTTSTGARSLQGHGLFLSKRDTVE